MNIKTDALSVLRLHKLFFKECEFKRNDIIDPNMSLKITAKSEFLKLDETKSRVNLEVALSDDDDILFVRVVCIGEFEIAADNTDVKNPDSLTEERAVAIMFPYVRSQISSITAQPDLTPIVIPPINVGKLLNQ